jgi:hypothetical protein
MLIRQSFEIGDTFPEAAQSGHLIEKLWNKFFPDNFLHDSSHELGARHAAFLSGGLQILDFQWDNDILDGHLIPFAMAPARSGVDSRVC